MCLCECVYVCIIEYFSFVVFKCSNNYKRVLLIIIYHFIVYWMEGGLTGGDKSKLEVIMLDRRVETEHFAPASLHLWSALSTRYNIYGCGGLETVKSISIWCLYMKGMMQTSIPTSVVHKKTTQFTKNIFVFYIKKEI